MSLDSVMYRLATCYDMVELATELEAFFPQPADRVVEGDATARFGITFPTREHRAVMEWSLKMLGNLFCLQGIQRMGAKRVLEVGAGYDKYLDRVLDPDVEYWMIDRDDYYPTEVFYAAQEQRARTRYVNGLLGGYSDELPDDHFDIVVSNSSLEHVPAEAVADMYRDMYRVLRPGGCICHTIDVEFDETEELGRRHLECIRDAGFGIDNVDMEWKLGGDTSTATFSQPLAVTYGIHKGERPRLPVPVRKHPIGTLLCLGYK